MLCAPSATRTPLLSEDAGDQIIVAQLWEAVGDYFAEKLAEDGAQARAIVAGGDVDAF
jgi:hypothetical protein